MSTTKLDRTIITGTGKDMMSKVAWWVEYLQSINCLVHFIGDYEFCFDFSDDPYIRCEIFFSDLEKQQ